MKILHWILAAQTLDAFIIIGNLGVFGTLYTTEIFSTQTQLYDKLPKAQAGDML